MNYLIRARSNEGEHSIAWIGVQPDNSISVGLNDPTFMSPKFRSRKFLWNAYNRIGIEYLVAHSPAELQPVANPHLTFHPPIYFHLRANGMEELFEGIADVGIMLDQDGRVPWIRLVSRPVGDIRLNSQPRNLENTEIVQVPVDTKNASVGISIDFVKPGEKNLLASSAIGKIIDSGAYNLHLQCEILPAQIPTLAWLHQA